MSDKVSYAIKPNKKRIIKLVICWVLLGLAFYCSLNADIVAALRVFAYDHDWINRRVVMSLADMIIMRTPLYLVLCFLILLNIYILVTELSAGVIRVDIGTDSILLCRGRKERVIPFNDLRVIKHKEFAEIGKKKAWLLNQVVVDKSFYDELNARGVSYEK